MKIVFVRHSKAVEKHLWKKDDFLRPLSKKGIIRAEFFAKKMIKLYPRVDIMISSEYNQASDTAGILKKILKPRSYFMSPHINKNCGYPGFEKLMKSVPENTNCCVIIAHVEDIECILKKLTGNKLNNIVMKKPSLADIDLDHNLNGRFNMVLSYDDDISSLSVFRKSLPREEGIKEIQL